MKKMVNFMLNWLTAISMFTAVYCAEGTNMVENITNAVADSSISYSSELTKIHTMRQKELLAMVKAN